jgi:hypothetical protein
MLDTYKYILEKVSFDKDIFRNELNKAMSSLKKEEAIDLFRWCKITFDEMLTRDLDKKK